MNDDVRAQQNTDLVSVSEKSAQSNSLRLLKQISDVDAAEIRRSINQAHNKFVLSLREMPNIPHFGDCSISEKNMSASMNMMSQKRPNRMKMMKSNVQTSREKDFEDASASCLGI
jgi:hypothetical protein